MKYYLYHWVPEDMEGDVLYSLNELKNTYPNLYDHKAAKYAGRERVMRQVIPAFGCLWNDVLHFTAVHPQIVKDALITAGNRKDLKMRCYEVDPELLDPKDTIVYLYRQEYIPDKMNVNNFTEYDPGDIETYSTLPQVTLDYYKETYDEGGRPLVFHGVPHVLYKGILNVKNLPIVEV